MFGYVRANRDALPQQAAAEYEATYCGLCHAMGERYGHFTRLFLNYDFTFLAMLLAPPGEGPETACRGCPLHPIRGKRACGRARWLDAAAGESVILTWWKLRDAVADSGFFKGLGARLLCLLLGPGYRRARRDYPAFDAQASLQLRALGELERAACPELDRTADCFAALLRAAVPETEGPDRARAELLYHLGRWIYLIDAVDDLDEDRRSGRYNPVLARFPQWSSEDKDYLRALLGLSRARMGAAFQLLERGAYAPAMENILYSGIPAVEELVFSGKWREYQKRHRRKNL